MWQVDELKTIPNEPSESAPALAAKALDQELGASAAVAVPAAPTQVNDLTSMVKKKKKPAVEANSEPSADINSATKRKAEDDASSSLSEKKARLEDAPAS